MKHVIKKIEDIVPIYDFIKIDEKSLDNLNKLLEILQDCNIDYSDSNFVGDETEISFVVNITDIKNYVFSVSSEYIIFLIDDNRKIKTLFFGIDDINNIRNSI